MGNQLIPRFFDKAMIEQAYPIVRTLAPGVTLERWVQFARPRITSRSPEWPHGLMAIQNPGGYILGLFAFEVRDDLHESRTLWVSNIVVPNIPGRDQIGKSIIDAGEHLAMIHGCRAIRADLNNEIDPGDWDRTWLSASLVTCGYSMGGVRAFKRLTGDFPGTPGNALI
jgi:hypothetical protein